MRRIFGIALALLMLAMPLAAVAAPTEPGGTFLDDDGNVHEGAIEAIADQGITLGCNPPTNDLYCPDEPVTRGQMAAFLVRALDLPASSDDLFTDDEGSVFEADINALAAAGITRGCNPPDNTRYCSDDPVTRGQMAAFLNRATGLLATASDFFTDDEDSIFDINAIAEKGITKGCNPPDNTRYCPDDDVLRDQMASFLARALDLDPITPPPPSPPATSGELTAVFVAVRQGDAALYRHRLSLAQDHNLDLSKKR